MTQENKNLLLKDISARLPYGVMVSVQGGEFDSYKYPYQLTAVSKFGLDSFCKVYNPIYTPFGVPNVENVKPYLRPMSSMTEKEWETLRLLKGKLVECDENNDKKFYGIINEIHTFYYSWHIDCNGLIEKGLALKAPKDMYKTE